MAFVGRFRAGLAHVNVLASQIFGGMSGSAVADAAGLGAVEIKQAKAAGYKPEFAAALTAASATIGPIMPPSVPMVLFPSWCSRCRDCSCRIERKDLTLPRCCSRSEKATARTDPIPFTAIPELPWFSLPKDGQLC